VEEITKAQNFHLASRLVEMFMGLAMLHVWVSLLQEQPATDNAKEK
jgi:hypothetical protein